MRAVTTGGPPRQAVTTRPCASLDLAADRDAGAAGRAAEEDAR